MFCGDILSIQQIRLALDGLTWLSVMCETPGVPSYTNKKDGGTKILFCGRDLKCFSLLRGANSKTTDPVTYTNFFSTQWPKMFHERTCCGPLQAKHPKRYQNRERF